MERGNTCPPGLTVKGERERRERSSGAGRQVHRNVSTQEHLWIFKNESGSIPPCRFPFRVKEVLGEYSPAGSEGLYLSNVIGIKTLNQGSTSLILTQKF